MTDLKWELGEAGATIWLPQTCLPIRADYRPGVDPQDLYDARRELNRRLHLYGIITAGLRAIKEGQAPEGAFERAGEYVDQALQSERAIWESCQLAIGLCIKEKDGMDWKKLVPDASDALISLATALYNRVGLSDDEISDLKEGALRDFGFIVDKDASEVRTCDCAEHHDRGPCPNWPAFDWMPKTKRIWNSWRTARAGGKVYIDLAYIDGAAVLGAIQSELEVASINKAVEEAEEQWSEKP